MVLVGICYQDMYLNENYVCYNFILINFYTKVFFLKETPLLIQNLFKYSQVIIDDRDSFLSKCINSTLTCNEVQLLILFSIILKFKSKIKLSTKLNKIVLRS